MDVQFTCVAPDSWPQDLTTHNPTVQSHTLREISTNTALTNELIRLVVSNTPAVQRLSVAEFRRDGFGQHARAIDGWSDRVWGVRELTVAQCAKVTDEHLSRLPATRNGEVSTLCIKGCVVRFDVGVVAKVGVVILHMQACTPMAVQTFVVDL